MEQEQEGENPQQTFCEYSIIRDIVLKVLKAQGIPNPSDEVIDSAIKEHLTPKVLVIIKKLNSEKRSPWKYLFQAQRKKTEVFIDIVDDLDQRWKQLELECLNRIEFFEHAGLVMDTWHDRIQHDPKF